MKKISEKRGSHIGFVLSFAIFIISLMFFYSIIKPQLTTSEEKNILENIKSEVLDSSHGNSLVISVSNNSVRGTENCLKINLSGADTSNLNWIVKDKNNNPVNSTLEGDFLKAKWIGENFFRIYYSEQKFNNYSLQGALTCANSTISSTISEDYTLEDKIVNLTNNLGSEDYYNNFKKDFGISNDEEFSVRFIYQNGTFIGAEKNVSGEIYSDESTVQYLDKDAGFETGKIRVRVWRG
jgi:hypothetical protein